MVGDEAGLADARMHIVLHQPIEAETEDGAYDEAHTDITKIVHAKIKAGEGGGEGPEEEGERHLGAAEEPGEEHGHAHGVAGMSGEEAETTSPITAHDINEIHQLRVLCGTPTGHQGLDDARTDAVGHYDEQYHGHIHHQGFFPGVVLEDDGEQDDDDEGPREGVCDGVHHIVPEEAVAAVDG